jgi:hypothetical protein
VDPSKEDVTDLQGMSYDANNVLVVRVKLPDVPKNLKSTRSLFHYIIAREAGLAYDYVVIYFDDSFASKIFPLAKLFRGLQNFELRSATQIAKFFEEVVSNSHSFQVGKSSLAIPLLRGIDLQGGNSLCNGKLGYAGPRRCHLHLLSLFRISCVTAPLLRVPEEDTLGAEKQLKAHLINS